MVKLNPWLTWINNNQGAVGTFWGGDIGGFFCAVGGGAPVLSVSSCISLFSGSNGAAEDSGMGGLKNLPGTYAGTVRIS